MASRERTWKKVRVACQYLVERKQKVTVQAVAAHAGVQRTTIYRDPELLNFVEKYEISFHFQKGKDESHAEYQRGFKNGYDLGVRDAQAAGAHKGRIGSAGVEWARGVMHIEAKEKLTPALVDRRFGELSHLLHPDKGGKDDLMRILLEARQVLKRAVGD